MATYEVPDPIINWPFATSEDERPAVKVVDRRGSELLVVKSLKEPGK